MSKKRRLEKIIQKFINAEDEIQRTFGNQYIPRKIIEEIYRKYNETLY